MHPTIELTTLSPVHIGAGQVLYRDLGFAVRDRQVHFQREILERPALPCAPDVPAAGCKELRLHLQDGTGRLLLPGSSIKGAMKTLWMAERLQKPFGLIAEELDELNRFSHNLGQYFQQLDQTRRDQWGKLPREPQIKSLHLEEAVMGGSFDTDPWQRLRPGDVAFAEARCEHVSIQNFHPGRHTGRGEYWQAKAEHWLLETIPAGLSSTTRMDWPWWEKAWGRAHEIPPRQAGQRPGITPPRSKPAAPERLLAALRAAMALVLDAELQFWAKDWATDDMRDYVAFLESMRARLQQCSPDTCILRIGYGSGFNAVTGGIPARHIQSDDDWIAFFRHIRRDKSGKYAGLDLPAPKTRKLVGHQQPLGFVQLRIPPQ